MKLQAGVCKLKKKRLVKVSSHQAYLKAFGANLERLIKERGYDSSYDFWINRAGDDISRSGLRYIISGSRDAKLSTLKILAELLEIEPGRLFEFDRRR